MVFGERGGLIRGGSMMRFGEKGGHTGEDIVGKF